MPRAARAGAVHRPMPVPYPFRWPGRSGVGIERVPVPEDKLQEHLLEIMDSIGFQLLKRAKEHLTIEDAKDVKELKKIMKKGGFARIDFCMKEKCAEKIEKDVKAEVSGSLFDGSEKTKGKCAVCGKKAVSKVYVAVPY